jgi:hypothetical protein
VAVTKKNQEQTIALALCFFLNGQPFHLAALKKAFTRIGTAFVHGLRAVKNKKFDLALLIAGSTFFAC